MNRYRVYRAAHIAGHAFWWVYVVATLLVSRLTTFGGEERDQFGWTAYSPALGGQPRRYATYSPPDPFSSINQLSTVAAATFCLLILAAAVEAVAVRRLLAGIVTVAVPFMAAALVLFAVPHWSSTFIRTPIPALLVILAAVATREVWARRLAPVVSPDGSSPASGRQAKNSRVTDRSF